MPVIATIIIRKGLTILALTAACPKTSAPTIPIVGPTGEGTLRPASLINSNEISITNNSKIILGKNNTISPWAALQIITYNPPGKESHGTVIIGNNNCFNGNFLIIPGADKEMPIVIGNNNLFAGNIQCQAISHHLVFDMNTKKQLNTEKGIKIGNNNWFGQEVLMLNKASIPDNCVIGIRSLINKSFSQNNSLIAGSPATTKRNNIGWHEYLDSSYLHTVNKKRIY